MLDPQDTFECVHPHDTDKPADEQRVFVYRHATVGYWMRYSKRYREAFGSKGNPKTDEQTMTELLELGGENLVGWRGVDREYDGDLSEVMMQLELMDLLEEVPASAMASELDKKKLRLQSRMQENESAKSVDPVNASDRKPLETSNV